MQKKQKKPHNKSKYVSLILSLSLIFAADTRMHPVLKGLGITDRAISFVVDSSNGSEVTSSRARGSLAKGPTPPRPVAVVDAARESQPGVHGGGLRCTCANGVRQARVSRWLLCPLGLSCSSLILPTAPLNQTQLTELIAWHLLSGWG